MLWDLVDIIITIIILIIIIIIIINENVCNAYKVTQQCETKTWLQTRLLIRFVYKRPEFLFPIFHLVGIQSSQLKPFLR